MMMNVIEIVQAVNLRQYNAVKHVYKLWNECFDLDLDLDVAAAEDRSIGLFSPEICAHVIVKNTAGEGVIGTASFARLERELVCFNLCVDKVYRGKGFGKVLIAKIAEIAGESEKWCVSGLVEEQIIQYYANFGAVIADRSITNSTFSYKRRMEMKFDSIQLRRFLDECDFKK
jgi:GNAT superfamily N-acetyltransferase